MSANQVNLEYFFRLIYDCFHGACYNSNDLTYAAFQSLTAQVWLWIIFIGYILSVLALGVIIYSMIRLFELREREERFYNTLLLAPEASEGNPRWKYIRTLLDGSTKSEWREAIIEADIMLDAILSQRGYEGENVSEKLRKIERSDLNTLQDAWEAHKVRNQIAHEGSAFDMSHTLASRTIQRYEAVFRELKGI